MQIQKASRPVSPSQGSAVLGASAATVSSRRCRDRRCRRSRRPWPRARAAASSPLLQGHRCRRREESRRQPSHCRRRLAGASLKVFLLLPFDSSSARWARTTHLCAPLSKRIEPRRREIRRARRHAKQENGTHACCCCCLAKLDVANVDRARDPLCPVPPPAAPRP